MLYYCKTKTLPVKRHVLEKALAFAGEFLNIEDDVCVVVKFSKTCNAAGYADWNEDEDEYEIEVNSRIPESEIIRTIFHELVHIRQMHNETYDPDSRTWNGEDCSHLEYSTYPWEVEAYGLEEEMVRKFKC